MTQVQNPEPLEGVAIIGMAGRFPGARNVDQFWCNLEAGRETISFFSEEELLAAGVTPETLRSPDYVRARGVLEDVELIDAGFFSFTPGEAALTAPEHRLFLECAWEALESSGYTGAGKRVGVFGGASYNTYLLRNLLPSMRRLQGMEWFAMFLANSPDHITLRTAYKLDLRGPSLTIQTACSTSLVAVHYACQSLTNGECDLALAGGAAAFVPRIAGYGYQEGGILSPDGHCRPFDAAALGTVPGSGAAVVVLKRLEDAVADRDPIIAVIRGSAVNNDGSAKIGYTAPSVEGQATVIGEALAVADVEPESVGYVETHGTGTLLGDPIEVAALTRAYGSATSRKGFCAIGSVKGNVGHLDVAAGVTGLIKAALVLRHGRIPPSLHFETPNTEVDFANSPFFVNTELREWEAQGGPRRAGVSSFGMGGTNAHVVLEQAPLRVPEPTLRRWHLLLLSARTDTALRNAGAGLSAFLARGNEVSLADAAFTLQVGRQPLSHRFAVVCRSAEDAVSALERHDPEHLLTARAGSVPPVVVMFPGQGAQHVNMGRGLYETEPTFRVHVDRCAEILRPHLGLDPRTILFPTDEGVEEAGRRLRETAITQPALFTVEYALAMLWMEWGVRPQALIGHSIGEYVAACLAGVFSIEDALALVAARGRLMQSLPAGAMLSVSLGAEEVNGLLDSRLAVAAENAPGSCVVSGPVGAVEELEEWLGGQGVNTQRLRTSHAFHSAMMEPILGTFAEAVGRVSRGVPEIPFLSNVTGTWIRPEEAADPGYWASHLRRTVRFSAGLRKVLARPGTIVLEAGPGQSLCALAEAHEDGETEVHAIPSMRPPREAVPDETVLLHALGSLWVRGAAIDWEGFWKHEHRGRVHLPTYPFERVRHWIEPPCAAAPQLRAVEAADIAGAVGGTTAEWLIEQQLRIMVQQLQALGVHGAGEAPGDVPAGPAHEDLVATPEPAAEVERVADSIPLTPVQHWFFEQEFGNPDHFNQAMLFEVHDRVDLPRLRKAITLLVERHDALRMRYAADGAGWYARPGAPSEAFTLRYEELAALAPEEQETTIERVAAEIQASLSLSEGPLLRVAFFGRGQRSGRLLAVVHHLAVDIFSWGILLGELEHTYRQLGSGAVLLLPAQTSSFGAWAARLQEYARSAEAREELGVWTAEERRHVRPLPRTHRAGRNTEAGSRTAEAFLDPEATRLLVERVPRLYAAQVNDVLLTALSLTLVPWADGPVLVDFEGHGREDLFPDIDLSRTVGWFTAIYPVLLDVGEAADPAATVARVRDQLHAVPRGGIGYGVLRYMSGDAEATRRLRAVPRAEVIFNYFGRHLGGGVQGLFGRPTTRSTGAARAPGNQRPHLLDVTCSIAGEKLKVGWRYAGDVHDDATIEDLARSFTHHVRALVHFEGPSRITKVHRGLTRVGAASDRISASRHEQEEVS